MNYTYLFGPVKSRRLGISLGIDTVSAKTCSLDCVYCECGKTTELTLNRREYTDSAATMVELADYLSKKPELDYITFGGSGEPTLNTGTAKILAFLKERYPGYKCALLTNGTLFHLPEVREEMLPFDIVLPSLDAVSNEVFSKVNRGPGTLDNAAVIDGLAAFRKRYTGTIWLEVFIVPGINDTPDELALFKSAIALINPNRVQLNSLDRPGTCSWVQPATPERLREIAAFLSPLPVEIITRQAYTRSLPRAAGLSVESAAALIARRPSTVEEIAILLNITINEAAEILQTLLAAGHISRQTVNGKTFYKRF